MSKRATALALTTVLAWCVATTTRADDDDVFLAVMPQPNVMILFDSSGSMSGEIDGVAKIDIAKQVVTDLISATPDIRFGVMKFRDNGAEMVAEVGTDPATLVAAVNGITQTSSGTPLGDQLYDAGVYFKGLYGGYSSPIQFGCQFNYALVITDGLQNSTTRDIQDEATLRFTQDHDGSLPDVQNVIVHTVGFGIADVEELAANAILQQAATNGGGTFYSTDNAAQLSDALANALSAIVMDLYNFSQPLIPSTSASGGGTAYVASFRPHPLRPAWQGWFQAYQLDAAGRVPLDADGKPLASALVWDAGLLLAARAASTRTIDTVIGGTLQSFEGTNVTPGMLGVPGSTERDKIVDYVRGIDAFDEDNDSNTTEERDWKLGDIFHSDPVLVTPPPRVSSDPSYVSFKLANSSRTSIVLVGANDGMLHAFRASDGYELWSFVPPDLLDDLQLLTQSVGDHRFFVDASPVVVDVKTGGVWRTIALIGERRGGNYYHALDITDTTAPTYLWSFTDAELGESWSRPSIGRVQLDGGSTVFAAFFGGGYDTADNNASGRAFFVIDLETGTKLWEYKTGGAGDAAFMNFSLPAPPTAVDLDRNGFIDRVYSGDVGGQLWKFDLSVPGILSGGLVNNWTGKRLFVADSTQANPPAAGEFLPSQAMYGAPVPARDDDGELWVLIGTGDRNHPLEPSQNRFYAIKDDTSMSNGSSLTESSLVDVDSGSAITQGWYFLLGTDEKVLATADVYDGVVYFTTYQPTGGDPCVLGASLARLYALRLEDGLPAIDFTTGEKIETHTGSESPSTDAGGGIPSEPEVLLGETEDTIVVGTTEGELTEVVLPPSLVKRLRYWREVF